MFELQLVQIVIRHRSLFVLLRAPASVYESLSPKMMASSSSRSPIFHFTAASASSRFFSPTQIKTVLLSPLANQGSPQTWKTQKSVTTTARSDRFNSNSKPISNLVTPVQTVFDHMVSIGAVDAAKIHQRPLMNVAGMLKSDSRAK